MAESATKTNPATMMVYCDEPGCRAKFAPVLKEKPVKGGGVKQYFNCPKCHKAYPTAIITKKGLKVRAQLKEIRSKGQDWLRNADNFKEYKKLLEEMKKETSRP